MPSPSTSHASLIVEYYAFGACSLALNLIKAEREARRPIHSRTERLLLLILELPDLG